MSILISAFALFAATSTPVGFTDDLDAAFKDAAKSGKCVYACFSGSDWCGWCVKLEREVFSKPVFLKSVTNDYALVFVDTPRDKSLLSDRAKAENPSLVEKYGIRGFPTAIVFDSNGKEVARTGYLRGGPEAYAKHLGEIRAKVSKPKSSPSK